MRLIVLGIPHTRTSTEYNGCAFTQKVVKFLEMMSPHAEVIHIGHKDSEIPDGVTHYTVTDDSVLAQAYGEDYVNNKLWKTQGFKFDINDSAYQTFTKNAVNIIKQIQKPNDILCVTFGYGHKAISDQLNIITVETGIGYPAAYAPYRIYESQAIMSAMYGPENLSGCHINNYHRVIPNYFKASDFTYNANKQDYVLYLGRIGSHKGTNIAIDACERANKKLIIAGQGSLKDMGYTSTPDHVEFVGYADVDKRRELMSNAQALFIASQYLEPFAGVQIEAFLSGTPVISPDHSAFTELNTDKTGIRCWTMKDYVNAVNNIHTINPQDCYDHAQQFLLHNVQPKFTRYFNDVLDLYTGNGWYQF
jgi:glycosyltransferase involved in cell wall biosynthesis